MIRRFSSKLGGRRDSPYDAVPMVRFRQRISRPIALVGTTVLLASCSFVEIQDAPLTIFEPAGPNAERIDGLFWLVFWIAKQQHGNAKLEVVWTVIPALILAAISVPTVSAVFELTGCDSDSMVVEVVGHQWWFEYNYPDQGIDTAHVMVIPAGQEICAVMTSDDVLHNFWIPALHGKRYLVPGQVTELRLESYEPGEFWGHCAEFCGLSHSLMRARVLAVTPSEFDAWVAEQQAPAALPVEGTPEYDGYQVFTNKGCVQCHTVRFDDDSASNIVPQEAFNGPDLTHFASRTVFAGASLPEEGQTYDAALKEWLADPPNVKPGSFMPNLALTSQEIDDLIIWLESNK
jgi:cytochrome c oxidase subunit 2